MTTKQTVTELDRFLIDNQFYDHHDNEAVNKSIMDTWNDKLQDSITKDLKEKLTGIEIVQKKSLFDLTSDNQGATLYKTFYELVDNGEIIEIIISLIINHNKGVIYLGSRHADNPAYSGKSKLLGQVYKKLKTSDKHFGYFRPVDFYTFQIG